MLSVDNKTLVSGGDDGMLKFWDLESELCQKKLYEHIDVPDHLKFSADSKIAVSVSYDGALRVWDLINGICQKALRGHTDRSFALLHFSQEEISRVREDSKKARLESNSLDEQLIQKIQSISLKDSDWTKVEFERTEVGRLKEFLDKKGEASLSAKLLTDRVSDFVLSSDGNTLISASYDGTLRVWDLVNGICRKSLSEYTDGISKLFLSTEGKMLVSASDDGILKVWDLVNGVVHRKTLNGRYSNFITSTDGKTLAFLGSEVLLVPEISLYVWNLESGVYPKILSRYADRISKLLLSTDGKMLVSGSDNGIIEVWDLSNKIKVWDLIDGIWLGIWQKPLRGHADGISDLVLSSDDTTLLSVSWDKTIKFWNLASGTCWKILDGREIGSSPFALSAKGDVMLCSSTETNGNYALMIWDVKTGQCLYVLTGYANDISSIVLSSQGLIITSDGSGAIKSWQPMRNENSVIVDYQLIWSTHQAQGPLWLENCQIEGAIGLSPLNQKLLEQRGAIGKPAPSQETSVTYNSQNRYHHFQPASAQTQNNFNNDNRSDNVVQNNQGKCNVM